MKTLRTFLEETYDNGIIQALGFTTGVRRLNKNSELPFEDLINDENWCLELIRTNLDYKSQNLKLNKAYAYRYRHITQMRDVIIAMAMYVIKRRKQIYNARLWRDAIRKASLCNYIHTCGVITCQAFRLG